MIAEQGQFEGSDWLSAVCGRGLAPASMPLDGHRLKIHSGVFRHLHQSCPNGMTLVCQWWSGHSDKNNTNNSGACVVVNYQKGRRLIMELSSNKKCGLLNLGNTVTISICICGAFFPGLSSAFFLCKHPSRVLAWNIHDNHVIIPNCLLLVPSDFDLHDMRYRLFSAK